MDWLKDLKNKSRSTQKSVSLIAAFLLTLLFAVPYFYMSYVYEPKEVSVESRVGQNSGLIATISNSVITTRGAIHNWFGGLFGADDEYIKQ